MSTIAVAADELQGAPVPLGGAVAVFAPVAIRAERFAALVAMLGDEERELLGLAERGLERVGNDAGIADAILVDREDGAAEGGHVPGGLRVLADVARGQCHMDLALLNRELALRCSSLNTRSASEVSVPEKASHQTCT
jgi:hypothetical protein